jgi:hypothetical protein
MNTVEEINKIKLLFDQGTITKDEFQILKKNILSKGKAGDNKHDGINEESSRNELSNKPAMSNLVCILMFSISFAGIALGLLFYWRYDSVLAIFITWVISITLPLIIYFYVRTRLPKWVELSIVLLLYILLIAFPIEYSVGSDSTPSSTQSSNDEGQKIAEFLINNTFAANENGVYFKLKFSSERGGWLGAMTMSMRECDFIYSYNLEGRSIILKYSGSNCNAQGGSATMTVNKNNTLSLIYNGQKFVFEPI